MSILNFTPFDVAPQNNLFYDSHALSCRPTAQGAMEAELIACDVHLSVGTRWSVCPLDWSFALIVSYY